MTEQVSAATQKKVEDISFALVAWFKSQEVDPPLAGLVMANLVASDLVGFSGGNSDKIDKSYMLFGSMLREMVEYKYKIYKAEN